MQAASFQLQRQLGTIIESSASILRRFQLSTRRTRHVEDVHERPSSNDAGDRVLCPTCNVYVEDVASHVLSPYHQERVHSESVRFVHIIV